MVLSTQHLTTTQEKKSYARARGSTCTSFEEQTFAPGCVGGHAHHNQHAGASKAPEGCEVGQRLHQGWSARQGACACTRTHRSRSRSGQGLAREAGAPANACTHKHTHTQRSTQGKGSSRRLGGDWLSAELQVEKQVACGKQVARARLTGTREAQEQ